MDGKVSYSDERVKAVFAKWKELVDGKFYLSNNTTYTWQESLSFLLNGKAAMILIGSFLGQAVPPDMKDKIGFFPFPTIKPDVPAGEDAPVDSMHTPAKAKKQSGCAQVSGIYRHSCSSRKDGRRARLLACKRERQAA